MYFVLEQFPLQKWADTHFSHYLLPWSSPSSSSLWALQLLETTRSVQGNGVWPLPFTSSAAQPAPVSHLHWTPLLRALVNDSNPAQIQLLKVHFSLQTAAVSWAQEWHKPQIFSPAFSLATPQVLPWQCAVWAAGCSRPRSSRCHPGTCGWRLWHPPGCSHRSRRAEGSSGTHPASAGFSRGHVLRLHRKEWSKTNIKLRLVPDLKYKRHGPEGFVTLGQFFVPLCSPEHWNWTRISLNIPHMQFI